MRRRPVCHTTDCRHNTTILEPAYAEASSIGPSSQKRLTFLNQQLAVKAK